MDQTRLDDLLDNWFMLLEILSINEIWLNLRS